MSLDYAPSRGISSVFVVYCTAISNGTLPASMSVGSVISGTGLTCLHVVGSNEVPMEDFRVHFPLIGFLRLPHPNRSVPY